MENGTVTVTATSKATADITVKAEWTKAKYTLTYDSNGGSTCSPDKVTKTYNEAWGTLCEPTRKGYTFTGWKNGSTTVTNKSKATANITVEAQWTKNNYKLTYNSDGGSTCNPSSVTKPYNEAWGTLCEPTRKGYTFSGWKNGSKTVTETSKATANITVEAQWIQNTYTLTYDSNGGSTCNPISVTKVENEAWGTLCETTRLGYKFGGWKNGSTTITAASKATANITVVAQWTPVHTLPMFKYTGSYELVKDDDTVIASGTNNKVTIPESYNTYTGKWKLRLLSSGNLTIYDMPNASEVDIFLVGGGQGGRKGSKEISTGTTYTTGSGGSGGYRKTYKGISISYGTAYSVKVGAGGESSGKAGKDSSITIGDTTYKASSGTFSETGEAGGYEFGSSNYDKKYGGGGGTGCSVYSYHGYRCSGSAGKDGGGKSGSSGWSPDVSGKVCKEDKGIVSAGKDGKANTGGGGGGGGAGCGSYILDGGQGGSGIVILRNKR